MDLDCYNVLFTVVLTGIKFLIKNSLQFVYDFVELTRDNDTFEIQSKFRKHIFFLFEYKLLDKLKI